MVERERRYYGYTFQGTRGVTQGCLLSSHICNFVVDSIFLHCVRLVAENELDPEEFGYTVAEKADFSTQMMELLPPPTRCVYSGNFMF